jgi:hypothetical protein
MSPRYARGVAGNPTPFVPRGKKKATDPQRAKVHRKPHFCEKYPTKDVAKMQNLTSDVRKCIAYGYTDETTISVGLKYPIEFTEY